MILLFTGIVNTGRAQKEANVVFRKKFYFTWGYTRAAYSRSTIRFTNLGNKYNPATGRYDYYDFTLHNVKAHDRPDFKSIRDVANPTIPQYVFRIGYSFSKKWDIELNYDHTKYVVDDWQRVRITGAISDHWMNSDTILDPVNFIHFEHSDGANFWMINLCRKFQLFERHQYFKAYWVVKAGAGVVIPRTDVTLFGEHLNNRYHLAGWVSGVETGLRLEFLRNGFFEFVGKGSYADYVNSFILGMGHGKASHHFITAQVTASIGFRFDRKINR